jgi:hypothetical protein
MPDGFPAAAGSHLGLAALHPLVRVVVQHLPRQALRGVPLVHLHGRYIRPLHPPSTLLDKNRRDRGKSQSTCTDPKMETAGSRSACAAAAAAPARLPRRRGAPVSVGRAGRGAVGRAGAIVNLVDSQSWRTDREVELPRAGRHPPSDPLEVGDVHGEQRLPKTAAYWGAVGGQSRWHSLVDCTHGDSLSRRFVQGRTIPCGGCFSHGRAPAETLRRSRTLRKDVAT